MAAPAWTGSPEDGAACWLLDTGEAELSEVTMMRAGHVSDAEPTEVMSALDLDAFGLGEPKA